MKKAFLVCTWVAGLAAIAMADPIIYYGDGGTNTWSDGLGGVGGGTFTSAVGSNGAEDSGAGHGPTNDSAEALGPDVPFFGKGAMITSWDNSIGGPSGQNKAGMDFMYDADPDFNGTNIFMSIWLPREIDRFGLTLIDGGGNSRGWFLSVVPRENWLDVSIDPTIGFQGPWDGFFQDPGFNLTNVLNFRITASATVGDDFFVPNPDPHMDPNFEFFAIGHIQISPEPGTIAVIGFGLAALIRRRRR
ncbi:MAG: hypothetical protein HONBIEJF_00617 [Fimbriimonadaceae bacterium]|nr:hypothetical protein [Fimbriimonadaceae bacterium]